MVCLCYSFDSGGHLGADTSRGQPQAATSPNSGRQTTASSGEQQAVYVINPPQDIKDDALANMRHHLGGVEAILAGLADGDLAKVSQAAADNGMSYMAGHMDMGMWAMSNGYPQWMNFCNPMHDQFDHIAAMAKSGSDIPTLTKETSVLLQKCSACHSAFKFE